jgi:hypothetical protein
MDLPLKLLNRKSLFFIGLLLFVFLSWKTTRLIILDFGIIWHMHVYLMSFLAIFSIFFFKNSTHLTKVEFVFICYIIFIVSSVVINIPSPNTKFIFDFLITPLIFVFAIHVGRKMSDYSFFYIFHIVSIFFLSYMWFEFINANFMDTSYIFYGDWASIDEDINFTRTRDTNGSFILRAFDIRTVRIMGPVFSVHATGTLIGAFAIYHLNTHKVNISSGNLIPFHLIIGVFYTILLFVNGVGTSIAIFIILILMMQKRKLSTVVFLSPLYLLILIILLIDRDIGLYINHLPDYSILLEESFLKLFFFGDNQVTPHTIHSEFRMLGKPFAMGIWAFILFHILLYFIFKSIKKINILKINYTPIWAFIISIYLGAFHYNTIFVFPNSFFIFFLMGFIAGRLRLFNNYKRSRSYF